MITPEEDPSEISLGVSSAEERYVNRELSWLSFNERVLQEAESSSVPLLERIKFLAIFSSNLDEFFRVRVASLKSLLVIRRKKRRKKGLDPTALLHEIHTVALAQQERFGQVFREEILPGLQDAGIDLIGEQGVDEEHRAIMDDYYLEHVAEHLEPVILGQEDSPPFLKDHTSYLVAELQPGLDIRMGTAGPELGIVEVPSPPLPRFWSTSGPGESRSVVFLDDVIRLNLHRVFPERVVAGAYAIKVSRDADLYLDDEFDTELRQAIKKSLGKRTTGDPIRFLYDMRSPHAMVTRLSTHFELREGDLIEGGRYHNLNDLARLPLGDLPELEDAPLKPLPHPTLEEDGSSLDLIRAKDRLLHFPYQSYGHVVRLLQEAAADPDVDAIWISLYRVASESEIPEALIMAAEKGKDVMAFVEVQARFDEELNLQWAERMERAGIRVIHGTRGIKVHAKLCLIRRQEGDKSHLYALLSTGNFNEDTARVYADHGLMTADPRLTAEVHRIFRRLGGEDVESDFEHLLVAPDHLRNRFNALIDAETEAARQGRPSGITAKMNSLQDRRIIDKLYEASAAGVPVRLLVRGICCLRPGVKGLSDSIEATSIVDRFLEHSRVFVFHADGAEKLYLSSADWMTRNLNRRVEVAFPIYDPDVRSELRHVLDLQCADNTKARIIDEHQRNGFARQIGGATIRSQFDTYGYLRDEVRVRWTDLRPGTLIPADAPILQIERESAGQWAFVADDANPAVQVRAVEGRGEGYLWEARWVPRSVPAGSVTDSASSPVRGWLKRWVRGAGSNSRIPL